MKALFLATACVLGLSACSDATGSGSDGVPVVQIAQLNLMLSVGDSADLNLLPMLPPGYVPSNVQWWSSDPAVVSVRRETVTLAVIRSVAAGRAVIHAEAGGAGDSTVVVVQ
jgi:hypothetical protein